MFLSRQQWRLGTTLDISGADSEYMQTEFGISEDEAMRTSFSQYEPDSGLKLLTWGLSAEYRLSPQWSVLSNTDLEYYLADAANSPLIGQVGTRTNTETSVVLRWQF